MNLEPFESKEIVLSLGEENNMLNAKDMAYKYSKISNAKEELNRAKRY